MSRRCWQPVFVGIGSNLDDPVDHVRRAIVELGQMEDTALVLCSDLYFSEPLGPAGQADYVNAVAGLLTQLEPEPLLDRLQAIEQSHGRDRSAGRWSSRTLDLDILAFARLNTESDRLTIPHPELHRREFVLGPWMDIAPHFEVVGLGLVSQLARAVDLGTLRRISPMS